MTIKYSKKIHLFTIISVALIVLGFALGTVFHFLSGNFFNYGGEYSSYKEVVVTYEIVEFKTEEEVKNICVKAFGDSGISNYAYTYGKTSLGGELTFRINDTADQAKIDGAVNAIETELRKGGDFSSVTSRDTKAVIGGEHVLVFASIALATAVAFSFIYTAIRFKFAAAFTAIIIHLHNLCLYAAILALCRVPVTSAAMAFGALVAIITAICLTFIFSGIRGNLKADDGKKPAIADVCDTSANGVFAYNVCVTAFVAIVAIIAFAALAISVIPLSPIAIISPVFSGILAAAVAFYGCQFYAPALFPATDKAWTAIKSSIKKKPASSGKAKNA